MQVSILSAAIALCVAGTLVARTNAQPPKMITLPNGFQYLDDTDLLIECATLCSEIEMALKSAKIRYHRWQHHQ